MTVESREGTTELTDDARIDFRGPLHIADPLVAVPFRRLSERATRGLERRLSQAA